MLYALQNQKNRQFQRGYSPTSLLKQCFIEDEVIIEVRDNAIVIRPVKDIKRKGWAKAFKEMAEKGDDELVIPDVFEDEDLSNWTWR